MTSDHPDLVDDRAERRAEHHESAPADASVDVTEDGPVYGPPIPPPPIPLWGWPPSPKLQIVLFAVACGLINLILLGVWAAVMLTR